MEGDTKGREWVVKEPDASRSSDCWGNRRAADLKAMCTYLVSKSTVMDRRAELNCGCLQVPGLCLRENA